MACDRRFSFGCVDEEEAVLLQQVLKGAGPDGVIWLIEKVAGGFAVYADGLSLGQREAARNVYRVMSYVIWCEARRLR